MEEANVDGMRGFRLWHSTANHRLRFIDIGLLVINCLTVGSDLQIHRIHILQGSTGSTGARMKISSLVI